MANNRARLANTHARGQVEWLAVEVEVEVEAMPALVLEPAGAATFRVAGATYHVARGMTARESPRL